MADKIVSLSDREVQRLQAIVLDGDQADALLFCKEVIQAKIKAKQPILCGNKVIADPQMET